eukprot:2978746-Alexandrium_andersonii.AAC.1
MAAEVLAASAGTLRGLLDRDRGSRLQSLAARASYAAMAGDAKVLYAVQKALRPWRPRTMAPMLQEDGAVASTALEVADSWWKYFLKRHQAVPATFVDIARRAAAPDRL